MNWKEAKRIKVGTIVRRSWETNNCATTHDYGPPQHGIVLAKTLEENVTQREMSLGKVRHKRYWLTVSWFKAPVNQKWSANAPGRGPWTNRESSWELMIVSAA